MSYFRDFNKRIALQKEWDLNSEVDQKFAVSWQEVEILIQIRLKYFPFRVDYNVKSTNLFR